ncbi:MAG TPA: TRL domain-containing protein [Geobacteraceae bacterium]
MRTVMKSGILLLLLAALLVSGCAYSNIQRPLGTEFNKTELGAKKGEASSHCVLWLVAWGDGGTKAAAENGHISVIRHADSRFFFLLFGLYARVTTIVYGD